MPSANLVCSQQYNLDISNSRQPLLVSHAKKAAPAGAPPPGPALLVPELCYLTGLCLRAQLSSPVHPQVVPPQAQKCVWLGQLELNGAIVPLPGLTDKMRNDFSIMKALHDHTKLNPEQRERRLNGFVSKIQK